MSSNLRRTGAACALVISAFAGEALAGQASPQTPPMTGGAQTLPPKYLSIPDFKVCLSSESQGAYQTWCLPRRKPGVCPAESWARLKALKGDDALAKCARVGSGPR